MNYEPLLEERASTKRSLYDTNFSSKSSRRTLNQYLNDTGQIDSLDSIFTCKTTGSAPLPINLDFINEDALSEVSIDTIIRDGDTSLTEHDFKCWDYDAWREGYILYFPNSRVEHQFWREYVRRFDSALKCWFLFQIVFSSSILPWYYAFNSEQTFDKICAIKIGQIAYTATTLLIYILLLSERHICLFLLLYEFGQLGFYTFVTYTSTETASFGYLILLWGVNLFFPVGSKLQLFISTIVVMSYSITLYLTARWNEHTFDFAVLCMTWFFVHIQARRYEFTYRNYFYAQHQSRIKRQQSSALLSRALPSVVSHKMKQGKRYASSIECGIIMFAKVVNFESMALNREPQYLVKFLNQIFSHWDKLIEAREKCYDVIKVETVGPIYMAASRILPNSNRGAITLEEDAIAVADLALEMIRPPLLMERFRSNSNDKFEIRIGIHCGPVVVGVIGRLLPRFRAIGSTVNCASRMQSTALPNTIQMSWDFTKLIDAASYNITAREDVYMKGFEGPQTTFLLEKGLKLRHQIGEALAYIPELSHQTSMSVRVSHEDMSYVYHEDDLKFQKLGSTETLTTPRTLVTPRLNFESISPDPRHSWEAIRSMGGANLPDFFNMQSQEQEI